jgi:tRNA dimethylallyltransferase
LLVIVGPTGSGKSALAIQLATRLRSLGRAGEIVNCDSLQLYRGLDIGTAKTPVAERGHIPHWLFDVLDLQIGYSAGEYARAARAVLQEVADRGAIPMVCGGTGFYLKALLDGLPVLPARDEALRDRLARREEKSPGSLHRLLSRLDSKAAKRLSANDLQKTLRALEIRLLTRESAPPPSEALPLQGFRVLKIGLAPERAALVRRIQQRTFRMFGLDASGREINEPTVIQEVQDLLAKGATGQEKPFESLGYKESLAYLRGQVTMAQAVESTMVETRQYAKRQMTWFRRDQEVQCLQGFGDDTCTLDAAWTMVERFVDSPLDSIQTAT